MPQSGTLIVVTPLMLELESWLGGTSKLFLEKHHYSI